MTTSNRSETIKTALMGAAGGAVALAIIGFSWGGWVTGGTAAKTAAAQTRAAVVAALAPVCVANFKSQSGAAVELATFQALSSNDRTSFIEKGGWAASLGTKDNVSAITRACSDALLQLKSADL
jgi:pimeloyl-ACP methyl ester carboxylesterase